MAESKSSLPRRKLLVGAALAGATGVAFALRRKILNRLDVWTQRADFAATPPLLPHEPARDRTSIQVARDASPADNIDAVIHKRGGLGDVLDGKDVVLVKVSAQWWNQGMTNVAAVKRLLEHVLEHPGEREVIVIENTHFQLADGSGLSRAWTRPSERNVDVEGWDKLGDLITHFRGRVGFVGLVDAGRSALSGDGWHDPNHEHGVYGGDGRGPLEPGDTRDGYHWDFDGTFRRKRSWLGVAQVPMTWPRFTAPLSQRVIDLRDGVFDRRDGKLIASDALFSFINMTTANEHVATGVTACCKSAMGLVDMSAGRLGTDPRIADYQSVHYFGKPNASWRMAGPLAAFAKQVRAPDLYLTVAEWVAVSPPASASDWSDDTDVADVRLSAASAHQTRTIIAGKDPVAIDHWVAKNLLMPIGGRNAHMFDVDDESSRLVKFLRYYREVHGSGTLDPSLVEVV